MRRTGVLLVGLAVVLSACGSAKTITSTAAAPAASSAAAATSATPAVLSFSVPKVGGGTINGADFAGKPVAFWFWAPT